MAFATAHKPHVRQEGFHLPSPPPSADTPPPHQQHNLFGAGGHSSGSGFHAGDFNDELASLIGGSNSNERSTQSPDNSGEYRPPPHTHNIFDISAPAHHHHAHHGSASSTGSSFPSHFSLNNNASNGGGNGGSGSTGSPATETAPPYHFNSTLPALNSSMRYDPLPSSNNNPASNYMPSPSSFRSPSPHHSRSRSRSRPPSSHNGTNGSSGGGPTRTTRTRRTGSLSSNSPPPRPVPQAIVIPGSHGELSLRVRVGADACR